MSHPAALRIAPPALPTRTPIVPSTHKNPNMAARPYRLATAADQTRLPEENSMSTDTPAGSDELAAAGSTVPPYEGRREDADIDPQEESSKDEAKVGGATGPVADPSAKALIRLRPNAAPRPARPMSSQPTEWPRPKRAIPASDPPTIRARREVRT
jgi:hypothetical protein